jgi:4-diphosphocytidyl-2C-methyl-D-erythritol kinase
VQLDKDTDYEFVEVKVSHKIDIKLSLDDLLNAVQQETNALEASAQQLPPQVQDHLSQLNQLANQLKGTISQIKPPGA